MSSVDGIGKNTNTTNQTDNADAEFESTLANTSAANGASTNQTQSTDNTVQQTTSPTPITAADFGDPVVEPAKQQDDSVAILVIEPDHRIDFTKNNILKHVHSSAVDAVLETQKDHVWTAVSTNQPNDLGFTHGGSTTSAIADILENHASSDRAENVSIVPATYELPIVSEGRPGLSGVGPDIYNYNLLDDNGEFIFGTEDSNPHLYLLNKARDEKLKYIHGEDGGINYGAVSSSTIFAPIQMATSLWSEMKERGETRTFSNWAKSDEAKELIESYAKGYEEHYQKAIEDLEAVGVIHVMAAGNSNAEITLEQPYYPKEENTEFFENVEVPFHPIPGGLVAHEKGLIIGATEGTAEIADWSNHGSLVHLYADGRMPGFISGGDEGDRENIEGTSFSAPIVATLAALHYAEQYAENPDAPPSASEIKQFILDESKVSQEGHRFLDVRQTANDHFSDPELVSSVTSTLIRGEEGNIVLREVRNEDGRNTPIIRHGAFHNDSHLSYTAIDGDLDERFQLWGLISDARTPLDLHDNGIFNAEFFEYTQPHGHREHLFDGEIPLDRIFFEKLAPPAQPSAWERQVQTYADGTEVINTSFHTRTEDGDIVLIQAQVKDGKVTLSSPLWDETRTYEAPKNSDGSNAKIYTDLPPKLALTAEELAAIRKPEGALEFMNGLGPYNYEDIDRIVDTNQENIIEGQGAKVWKSRLDTFEDGEQVAKTYYFKRNSDGTETEIQTEIRDGQVTVRWPESDSDKTYTFDMPEDATLDDVFPGLAEPPEVQGPPDLSNINLDNLPTSILQEDKPVWQQVIEDVFDFFKPDSSTAANFVNGLVGAVVPDAFGEVDDDTNYQPLSPQEAKDLIQSLNGAKYAADARRAQGDLFILFEQAETISELLVNSIQNNIVENNKPLDDPTLADKLENIANTYDDLIATIVEAGNSYKNSEKFGEISTGAELITFLPHFLTGKEVNEEAQKVFFDLLHTEQAHEKEAARRYNDGQAISQEAKEKLTKLNQQIKDLYESDSFKYLPKEMQEDIEEYVRIDTYMETIETASEIGDYYTYFNSQDEILKDIINKNYSLANELKEKLSELDKLLDTQSPATGDEELLDDITADIEKIKKDFAEIDSITSNNINYVYEEVNTITRILNNWAENGNISEVEKIALKSALYKYFNKLPDAQKTATETTTKVNSSFETLSEINEKIKKLKKNRSLSESLEEWWEDYYVTVENQKGHEALEKTQELEERKEELFPGQSDTKTSGTTAPIASQDFIVGLFGPLGSIIGAPIAAGILKLGSQINQAVGAENTGQQPGQPDLSETVDPLYGPEQPDFWAGVGELLAGDPFGTKEPIEKFLEETPVISDIHGAIKGFAKQLFGESEPVAGTIATPPGIVPWIYADEGNGAPIDLSSLPFAGTLEYVLQNQDNLANIDTAALAVEAQKTLDNFSNLTLAQQKVIWDNRAYYEETLGLKVDVSQGEQARLNMLTLEAETGTVQIQTDPTSGNYTIPDYSSLNISGLDSWQTQNIDTTDLNLFERFDTAPVALIGGKLDNEVHLWIPELTSTDWVSFHGPSLTGTKGIKSVPNLKITDDGKFGVSHALVFDELGEKNLRGVNPFVAFNVFSTKEEVAFDFETMVLGEGDIDAFTAKHGEDVWDEVTINITPGVIGDPMRMYSGTGKIAGLAEEVWGIATARLGLGFSITLKDPAELRALLDDQILIDNYGNPIALRDFVDYLPENLQGAIGVLKTINEHTPHALSNLMLEMAERHGENNPMPREEFFGKLEEAALIDGPIVASWFHLYDDFLTGTTENFNNWLDSGNAYGDTGESSQSGPKNWDTLSSSQQLIMLANSANYLEQGIVLPDPTPEQQAILDQFGTATSDSYRMSDFEDQQGFFDHVNNLAQSEQVQRNIEGLGGFWGDILSGDIEWEGVGALGPNIIDLPEDFEPSRGDPAAEDLIVDKKGNLRIKNGADLSKLHDFFLALMRANIQSGANDGDQSKGEPVEPISYDDLSQYPGGLLDLLIGTDKDGNLVLDHRGMRVEGLVDRLAGPDGSVWSAAISEVQSELLTTIKELEDGVDPKDLSNPKAYAALQQLNYYFPTLDMEDIANLSEEDFAEKFDKAGEYNDNPNLFAFDTLYTGPGRGELVKGFVYEQPLNLAVAKNKLAVLEGLQLGGLSTSAARGLLNVMAAAKAENSDVSATPSLVNMAANMPWQTFGGVEQTNALNSEALAAIKEAFSRISGPREQLMWAFEVAQDPAAFEAQIDAQVLQVSKTEKDLELVSTRPNYEISEEETKERNSKKKELEARLLKKQDQLTALQAKQDAYDLLWPRKEEALSEFLALLNGLSDVVLGLEDLLAVNGKVTDTVERIGHLLSGLDGLETNLANESLHMASSNAEFKATRDGVISDTMFRSAYQESQVSALDYIAVDWKQKLESSEYWKQVGNVDTEIKRLDTYISMLEQEHTKLDVMLEEWNKLGQDKKPNQTLKDFRTELATLRNEQVTALEAARTEAADDPTYQTVLSSQINNLNDRQSELTSEFQWQTVTNQRLQVSESLHDAKTLRKEYQEHFTELSESYFAGDSARQALRQKKAAQMTVYAKAEAYAARKTDDDGQAISAKMRADVTALMDALIIAMEKTDKEIAALDEILAGGDALRASMLDFSLDKAVGLTMQGEMGEMFATPVEGGDGAAKDAEPTTGYLDLLKRRGTLENELSVLDGQIDEQNAHKESIYELVDQLQDANHYLTAQASNQIQLMTIEDHRTALIEEREADLAADPDLVLPPLEEALGLRLERVFLNAMADVFVAQKDLEQANSAVNAHKNLNEKIQNAVELKKLVLAHDDAKAIVKEKEVLQQHALRNLIAFGGKGMRFDMFGTQTANTELTPESALEAAFTDLRLELEADIDLKLKQLNNAQKKYDQKANSPSLNSKTRNVQNMAEKEKEAAQDQLDAAQYAYDSAVQALADFDAELPERTKLLAQLASGEALTFDELKMGAEIYSGLIAKLEGWVTSGLQKLQSHTNYIQANYDNAEPNIDIDGSWAQTIKQDTVAGDVDQLYRNLLALQKLESEAGILHEEGLTPSLNKLMTALGATEGTRAKLSGELGLINRHLSENHNWSDVEASYEQAKADIDALKLELNGPKIEESPSEFGVLSTLQADQHRENALQGDRLQLLIGLKVDSVESPDEAQLSRLTAQVDQLIAIYEGEKAELDAKLTELANYPPEYLKGLDASIEEAIRNTKNITPRQEETYKKPLKEAEAFIAEVNAFAADVAPRVDAQLAMLKNFKADLADHNAPKAALAWAESSLREDIAAGAETLNTIETDISSLLSSDLEGSLWTQEHNFANRQSVLAQQQDRHEQEADMLTGLQGLKIENIGELYQHLDQAFALETEIEAVELEIATIDQRLNDLAVDQRSTSYSDEQRAHSNDVNTARDAMDAAQAKLADLQAKRVGNNKLSGSLNTQWGSVAQAVLDLEGALEVHDKAEFNQVLASHQGAVADQQSVSTGLETNYETLAESLAADRVGLEADLAAAMARYDAVHYTYADYESVYIQLQGSEASATRFADLMEAYYTTLDDDPENDETRHFWLSPEAALQNIFEQSDAGASNEASADWAAFVLEKFPTLTELRLGMADLAYEVSVNGGDINTPAHDDPGSVFGDLAFLRHQLLNSGEGLSLQEMQAVETGLNLTILKAFADAGYFEAERVALEGHPDLKAIEDLDKELAETSYGVLHEDIGDKVYTEQFHRIVDVSDLQGDRLVVDFDLQGVAQDRNPSRAVIVVKNLEDGSTLSSTQINAPLTGTTDWQHTQIDLSALPHGKPLDLEGVDQVVIEVRTDFGAQVKGLTVSGHQHKLQGAERVKALADRDELIESTDKWGWQLDIAASKSELQAKRDELQAQYDANPTEALAHELAHLDAQLHKALDDNIHAQVEALFADLGLEEGKPLGALDLRKTGMLSHLDTEVFVMDSELPPEGRSDTSKQEKRDYMNAFLLRNLGEDNDGDILKNVRGIMSVLGKGGQDNKDLKGYYAFQGYESISLTEGITDEITTSKAHLDQAVARYAEKHENLMEQRENVAKAQADPMPMVERSVGQIDLRQMMPGDAMPNTEISPQDEKPLVLDKMSLANILQDEKFQTMVLGLNNPIILSTREPDNQNTSSVNSTANTTPEVV